MFRVGTDKRESEIDVSHIPLSTLQTIFGLPANDPMYLSFSVEGCHVGALQPLLESTLDLTAFEYILEAEAS